MTNDKFYQYFLKILTVDAIVLAFNEPIIEIMDNSNERVLARIVFSTF